MIAKLVIASANPGKLREIQAILAPLNISIVAQKELGISEADEPHGTFIENALAKARHANDPEPILAEGAWQGEIVLSPRGINGFGYDPYFFLPAFGKTSAELEPAHKNRISHRAQALEQLMRKLQRPI